MTQYTQDVRRLVEIRLQESLPDDAVLYTGGKHSLTKEEMIQHVRAGDEIGNNLIAEELESIRSMTKVSV